MSFQGSWHDGPQGGTPLNAAHLNAEEVRLHGSAVTVANTTAVSSITRDAQGRVTAFTDIVGTIDQITYDDTQGGRVSSFREYGTARTVSYDTTGQVTGVS